MLFPSVFAYVVAFVDYVDFEHAHAHPHANVEADHGADDGDGVDDERVCDDTITPTVQMLMNGDA